MKRRKGFSKIVINGEEFLFNWVKTVRGVMLIMYDREDKRIEILWDGGEIDMAWER